MVFEEFVFIIIFYTYMFFNFQSFRKHYWEGDAGFWGVHTDFAIHQRRAIRFNNFQMGGTVILTNNNYQKSEITQIRPYSIYRDVINKLYVGGHSDCANPQRVVPTSFQSLEGSTKILPSKIEKPPPPPHNNVFWMVPWCDSHSSLTNFRADLCIWESYSPGLFIVSSTEEHCVLLPVR